jgi:hypothetical protein
VKLDPDTVDDEDLENALSEMESAEFHSNVSVLLGDVMAQLE